MASIWPLRRNTHAAMEHNELLDIQSLQLLQLPRVLTSGLEVACTQSAVHQQTFLLIVWNEGKRSGEKLLHEVIVARPLDEGSLNAIYHDPSSGRVFP